MKFSEAPASQVLQDLSFIHSKQPKLQSAHVSPSTLFLSPHLRHRVSPRSKPAGQVSHLSALRQVAQFLPQVLHEFDAESKYSPSLQIISRHRLIMGSSSYLLSQTRQSVVELQNSQLSGHLMQLEPASNRSSEQVHLPVESKSAPSVHETQVPVTES